MASVPPPDRSPAPAGGEARPALPSLLPGVLLRQLAATASDEPGAASAPMPAVVLFADITAYTALVDEFARGGARGIEALSGVLNECLGRLDAQVRAHGGEILRFVGDAALALWTAPDEAGLEAAAARAARCALAIQQAFSETAGSDGRPLRLRVGVGAGTVRLARVGGVQGRWEFLVGGEPFAQVAHAQTAARPGEVLLSAKAWALLGPDARGAPLPDGLVRLEQLDGPGPPPEPPRPAPLPDDEALRRFIPALVLERLEVGQRAWLTEMRAVTVLFLELLGVDVGEESALGRVDAATRVLQAGIAQFGGSVSQLLVDDTGPVLVAAWGLPGRSSEDAAPRAVKCARHLQAELAALGLSCSVGIATGRAFCGLVGNGDRCEYAMIGAVVNFAARLMKARRADLLVDEGTRLAASDRVAFEAVGGLALKGKERPVEAYRPSGVRATPAPGAAALVGREAEGSRLRGALEAARRREGPRVVFVEGEAGLGKSSLVKAFTRETEAAGVRVLRGAGDAVEPSTALLAWRGVFQDLLDPRRELSTEQWRAAVDRHLRDDPALLPWLPLLNAALPLQEPETELTRNMPAVLRGEATRTILLALLERAAADADPLVVVLDDAHWMDSASWALALAARARLPKLLLVLLQRPGDAPAALETLEAAGELLRLPLSRLTRDEVSAVLCRRFGVTALDDGLADFLHERAGGNPFYAVALGVALRDAGSLEISDRTCRLVETAGGLAAHALPATLQGVIASRIDRLTPRQQLLVKVASAIGAVFEPRVLTDVFPVEEDRRQLAEDLDALTRLDLAVAGEGAETYSFRHGIIREAAYELMVPSQRRQLHGAIAAWFEREEAVTGRSFAPLLSHHWSLAEDDAKTFEYLEKSGIEALSAGANREAIQLLRKALALADARGSPAVGLVGEPRRARLLRLVGDAFFAQGDLVRSREQFDAVLQLAGQQLPRGRGGWMRRFGAELVRQIGHLVLPERLYRRASRDHALLAESIAVGGRVAEQRYYAGDLLGWATCLLMSINLAESTGQLGSAARGYGGLGYLAGLMRLHPLARRWFRRGRLAEDRQALSISLSAEGLYHQAFGRWPLALELLERSLAEARAVGDRYSMGVALFVLGVTQDCSGPPARAQRTLEELLETARASGNAQQETWALTELASVLSNLGRLDEARRRLDEAARRLEAGDDISVMRYHGVRALVALRGGELDHAERAAAETLAQVRRGAPLVYSYLWAFTGMAETCLAAWELARAEGPADRAEAQARRAREAARALRGFARLLPVGRSRSARIEGLAASLGGHPARARRCWRRALALARTAAMPLDEALAHLELARRGALAPADRAAHLSAATALFESLGCELHLREARQLAGDPSRGDDTKQHARRSA